MIMYLTYPILFPKRTFFYQSKTIYFPPLNDDFKTCTFITMKIC